MPNIRKWTPARIVHLSGRTKPGLALGIAYLLLLAVPLIAQAPQGAVRLHVIANSDSISDQSVKLSVRDAVLAAMEPALAAAPGKAEARALLMQSGEALQSAAEDALKARGAPYSAQMYYGGAEFPSKLYGERFYPAGEYEALRVVLGEGGGENWWCVMFPPLCLVDLEQASEPIEGEGDKIVFESAIAKLFS